MAAYFSQTRESEIMTKEHLQIKEDEWARLPPIYPEPKLGWSYPQTCVLDDRTYDEVPILFDRMGRLVGAPTAYFLHLTVKGAAPGTVKADAYSLRMFWSHLGEDDWRAVDDAALRTWRNHRLQAAGNKSVNGDINALVRFYLWAQELGWVANVIGETPEGRQAYPIRLIRKNGRKGYGRLVWADQERANTVPRLPVPDYEEVDRLYERLSGPNEAVSVRDCLMADLAVECGLRRAEIVDLNVADIPPQANIAKFKAIEKPFPLPVTGKGKKTRLVPVLPERLEKIRDYIRWHRKSLIAGRIGTDDALFVSKKTGRRLTKEWVSKIFSRAFGASGGYKLTLHRLRARFASLVVLTMARREMKKNGLRGFEKLAVLHAAAEVLGHSNIKSLNRYLDLALRVLKAGEAGKEASPDTWSVSTEVLVEVAQQNAGDRAPPPSETAKRREARRPQAPKT